MTIFRIVKNKNYFYASNEPFNDRRLSWAARGVMGYLLSKPNDWVLRTNDLREQFSGRGGGRDACEAIIRELKNAGYIRRIQRWRKDGRIWYETQVFESLTLNPDINPTATVPGKPGYGLPGHGKPGHLLNTDLLNTENKQNGKSRRQPPALPILTEAAAATNTDEQRIKLLKRAGIGAKVIMRLLQLDHVTPDYITAHVLAAEKEAISKGLLVTRMRDGDPAPIIKDPHYIPAQYREIVKR